CRARTPPGSRGTSPIPGVAAGCPMDVWAGVRRETRPWGTSRGGHWGHHRNMVSRPLWAAWRALSIKPVGHGMPGEENLVLFTHSWNLTKLVGIEEAGPSGGRGPIR